MPPEPRVTTEPLTPENLEASVDLWPDRALCSEQEFATMLHAAQVLLRERRGLGALLREEREPRAIGMSVFLSERFVADYLACPHAQLGKRILLEALGPDSPVLTTPGIAAGNAGHGLDLGIALTNIGDTANRTALLGHLIQAFLDTHRGYNIARLVNEVFGAFNVQFIETNIGLTFADHARFECVRGDVRLPAILGVVTREQAGRGTPLLPLFMYNHPRIFFSPAEQDLLRVALDGDPNRVLARKLGISGRAMAARWKSIHDRARRQLPELFSGIKPAKREGERGAQWRHVILRYVREQRSELTPYASAARE